MGETVFGIIQWWVGLFGVTEPAYVKLAVTLVACAALWAAIYLALAVVVTIIGTIADGPSRK